MWLRCTFMDMVITYLPIVLAFLSVFPSVAVIMSSNPPTVPARQQVMVTPNGSEYLDPYSWLRDDHISDPEMLSYLNAENTYAKSLLEQNIKLEDTVLADMGRRVPRMETTPPQPSYSLSYWYGSRRGPGQDYWVHTRRPAAAGPLGTGRTGPLSYGPDLKAVENVVLDINRLARGFDYCDVPLVRPSPDGRYVAFTVDTVGGEQYELVVQEIANAHRLKLPGWVESGAGGSDKTAFSGSLWGVAAAVEWSPDSSAVFVLRLTSRTHEAYQLVRVTLPRGKENPPPAPHAAAGSEPPADRTRAAPEAPEALLQDNKSGAVLELVGFSGCSSRYLVVSRRAEGYTTLLSLDMTTATANDRINQTRRGVPKDVKLYGTHPWAVIAPESGAVDVLRAVHLYDDTKGRQTWAVLMDSDKYPDGSVYAVTGGDIKGRTLLVPGRRGRQVVNIAVAGSGCGVSGNGKVTNGTSDGGNGNGHYLVVHTLEIMEAAVQVYDLRSVRQVVAGGRNEPRRQRQLEMATTEPRQRRALGVVEGEKPMGEDGGDKSGLNDDLMSRRTDDEIAVSEYERHTTRTILDAKDATSAIATSDSTSGEDGEDVRSDVSSDVSDGHYANNDDNNNVISNRSNGTDDDDGSTDDEEDDVAVVEVRVDGRSQAVRVQALGSTRTSLPLLWSFSPSAPGAAISSISLDTRCWPTSLPYVRLSYSSMTTPSTTVDLDLAAKKAATRQVEVVPGFSSGTYRSDTFWATSTDGTAVPATVACRTDAWPPITHRPLPCVVQAYGAYGRKLLPDFIPADLSFLDGVSSTEGVGSGPMMLVIAHARGGGELGSAWHINGKQHKKINTADDVTAVVQMLIQQGYCQSGAVAVWGRSAGGLAAGMTLNRSPPGTFAAALLEVPFLDVLGAMTDPSLPLTIKERPEWGDPAGSQEDFDYIQSYSPYEHVEQLVQHVPAILVTCSLNDPRVPYWGPAKYVARLRAAMAAAATAAALPTTTTTTTFVPANNMQVAASGGGSGLSGSGTAGNTDSGGGSGSGGGPVMLLTEMGAGGHFSASGASSRLAERAMRVAFLMTALGRHPARMAPTTPAAAWAAAMKPPAV